MPTHRLTGSGHHWQAQTVSRAQALDVRGHGRLVADVAAHDHVPATLRPDDIACRQRYRYPICDYVRGDGRTRQRIDLSSFDRMRTSHSAGYGGDTAASREVEH